jgi:DNA (cytosine-5)-methyltransferase 1
MKNKIFKLGELFCGPGGLALGAGLARNISKNGTTYSISHIWGVDKDTDAIATYQTNIVERYGGIGVCIGATEFCDNEIEKYPRITALAFGFPCNDFSMVGKQKGIQGKYGNLYKAGIKAIKKCNPYWFVAENVSGIHSANSGEAFRSILSELESSGKDGYDLTVNLYKFEDYGVPQYRHRFIIVGIRRDQKLQFKVPAPTHDKEGLPHKTVTEAINEIDGEAENTEFTRQDSRIVLRLKFTPPWHNAWFLDTLIEMSPQDRMQILRQLPWYNEELSNLTDKDILRQIDYARLKCTRARMSHIYRRLDPNRPSYTITGSGGGGTHVYHWREHRALTNRERAKLQSFPDWFRFEGSKEQVRKQIGMAVPPEGAKIIFESILKTFAGIEYKSVDPSYKIR